MAWVENETWPLEQGIDGEKIFQLLRYDDTEEPWVFTGFDVNARISDKKDRVRWDLTIETDPANGLVRVIAPWGTVVSQLRPGKIYRYDVLMVAPGAIIADDNFLVTGPVTVPIRSSRRDDE